MKKIRYWWWLTIAFIEKRKKIILAASLLAILAAFIMPGLVKYLPKWERKRNIGMIGRYRFNELPMAILNQISDGITGISLDGTSTPNLAKSWEITDVGNTYEFKIDTNRIWQDGSMVSRINALVRIQNVEVESKDEETLIFRLKEPYAPFPTLLSRPLFKSGTIGTGKYKVKRIVYNGEFIDQITLMDDTGQKNNYRFYRTSTEILTAFKLGEINEINDLTSIQDLPKWKEIEIIPKLGHDRYVAVFFNNNDENLAEKSFRQALTYAIPNKPNDERRSLSPISSDSWAYNPQVKPYNTDADLASEIVKSLYPDRELPKLELTTTLPYLSRAEEIANAWNQIGIETKVKVVPVVGNDFQALVIGQQIPADPDQYLFWHSTQPTNITHYASPKVDKLLEDGRKTLDKNKRKEIYRDFQRFLLEDCPAAFLEHVTTYTVKRK